MIHVMRQLNLRVSRCRLILSARGVVDEQMFASAAKLAYAKGIYGSTSWPNQGVQNFQARVKHPNRRPHRLEKWFLEVDHLLHHHEGRSAPIPTIYRSRGFPQSLFTVPNAGANYGAPVQLSESRLYLFKSKVRVLLLPFDVSS